MIEFILKQGKMQREIAQEISVSPSTIVEKSEEMAHWYMANTLLNKHKKEGMKEGRIPIKSH
ncbi:MAG: hypothetical protein D6799_07080 [Bacteroidetes bacterium]|nr:MAG: hypothetical protein D6799_07080 [Bacteroidota bacterium]